MSKERAGARIFLDALAHGPEPGGVGRYVTTLVQGLAEEGGDARFTIIARAGSRDALAGFAGDVRGPGAAASRPPWRAIWEQCLLPWMASSRTCDLLHGLMGVVPIATRVARVVTIHDVTFLTHPELHEPKKVRYFKALLPLAVRVSRRVLTDSAASAEAIVRHLRVPAERVHVAPLAVDPAFFTTAATPLEAVRRAHRLGGPYLLYAGVLEPRKNLPGLIDAVVRLRRLGYPHQLALAGKPGWDQAPIERALAAAGEAVRRLGYVTDAELRALMAGADAFIYVPLAEGFGLPVAEAMAAGVPVVTSDRSSLPEVAAGAAVLVDPTDPGAIAAGIRRLLDDPGLRADLVGRGLARAASLSPAALARATIAAYDLALDAVR